MGFELQPHRVGGGGGLFLFATVTQTYVPQGLGRVAVEELLCLGQDLGILGGYWASSAKDSW